MHITIKIGSLLTFSCIKDIKVHKSIILQAIFGAMVKFALVPDFRDLLTFGDLINILIYIMFILLNRVLKYKHFNVYFVVL